MQLEDLRKVNTNRGLWFLVLLLALAVPLHPQTQAEEKQEAASLLSEIHLTRTTDQLERVLVLAAEKGWRGFHRKYLLLTPAEQRPVILRSVLDPVAGTVSYRLEDDVSGWWLEVVHQAKPAPTLTEFFDANRSMMMWDPVAFELRSSSGARFRGVAKETGSLERCRMIVTGLEETGLAKEIRESQPDGLATAITSLFEMLEGDGYDSGSPDFPFTLSWLPVLWSALGLEQGNQALTLPRSWRVQSTRVVRPPIPDTPELLEFLAKFRSVQNTDPLAGSRLADLFGPDDQEAPAHPR